MSLFTKKTEKDTVPKEKKGGIKKKAGATTQQSKKIETIVNDSELAYQVLLQPWITEKTHDLASSGKYVFKINRKAYKKNTAIAIEELYGVKVDNVNIVNIPAKKRLFRGSKGRKAGFKKAIVTLKKGDRIELFG